MRLFDYIQQGGMIMYILLFLNIVGVSIMLTKFFVLRREGQIVDKTSDELKDTILRSITSNEPQTMIEMSKQELSSHMSTVEKGLNTVKIIAAISPLLGLLGTVIGVFLAFKVMAQTGLNSPTMFAKGISMALLTTVGGMIVAIPHYIGHSYLLGMVDSIESLLEKRVLAKVVKGDV